MLGVTRLSIHKRTTSFIVGGVQGFDFVPALLMLISASAMLMEGLSSLPVVMLVPV